MRIHFTVRGRVQGVGFRYFVISEADRLQLTGWVRNCQNGDVEGEAQGPEKVLEKFIGRLEQGPALSRVESVTRPQVSERDDSKFFEIKD